MPPPAACRPVLGRPGDRTTGETMNPILKKRFFEQILVMFGREPKKPA